MSCFLFTDDEESQKKINIDDLYQKKQQRELKQLSIFNKILNRVHKRIQTNGKNKVSEKHVWFTVPEYIFGEPLYNKGDCIGYLVTKLQDNGFHVRYVHPNTLFVSWHNWVPSYVRSEFKKQTGKTINERGEIIDHGKDEEEDDPNMRIFNKQSAAGSLPPGKEQKQFTPISMYRPNGKLVYNDDMFEKLEKKVVSFNPNT
jgi:hypothetical protein